VLLSGDVTAARSAADELAAGSASLPTVHQARAAEAVGAVLLAENDAPGALSRLRQALEVWTRLGMPYDAARVRVRIGDACRASATATPQPSSTRPPARPSRDSAPGRTSSASTAAPPRATA